MEQFGRNIADSMRRGTEVVKNTFRSPTRLAELRKLAEQQRLLDKIQWHRGFGRVDKSPLDFHELVETAKYLDHVSSTTGVEARALILPESHAAVFQLLNGRHAGTVLGVKGGIFDHYRAMGGPSSHLGLPITDEYEMEDLWRSDFEGGSIIADKNPFRFRVVDPPAFPQSEILADWSKRDLKKTLEPIANVNTTPRSIYGTEGYLMEFREAEREDELRHALFYHASGPHAGRIAQVYGWDYDYYSVLGGTSSELGFPLPGAKKVEQDKITIGFEGGTIIWTPQNGFSHHVNMGEPLLFE